MDYETTLRCLGYGIDFIWLIGPVGLIGFLTWRLAR